MEEKKTRYAGYPFAVVYKNPDGKDAVQQLLWGDWIELKGGEQNGYLEVKARGEDGWVHKDQIQTEPLLEIIFVDIGQGDGCLLVTPQDKHMVIDAGQEDNMARFLNWRYAGFKDKWEFECAVISHPDADHYKGFKKIFETKNVFFKTIYHNGIVEREDGSLGPMTTSGNTQYLTDIIQTHDQLVRFLENKDNWMDQQKNSKKQYPSMLKNAIDNNICPDFRMLSTIDGYMPGYEPDKDLSIAVIGPVVEKDGQAKPLLRWMKDVGKTKNGHSIVLKIKYRKVGILLGGDLNIPAENLLLSHHAGLESLPENLEDHPHLDNSHQKKVSEALNVDIAKSCHHGSADFSIEFLKALAPIVTVISSGDDESYSHPRSDTLGTIGRHSRGERPLIFSTELARSAKENIKHPNRLKEEFMRIDAEKKEHIENHDDSEKWHKKKERLDKEYEKLLKVLQRSIAVYGAINLRTDGKRVVLAQKIEHSRNKDKKWDIYQLEADEKGELKFKSKFLDQSQV